ncbi:MAG: tyrosine/phenylalanine carboxypeptidase domain-containing protein [Candidatus Woesearchaeota archaeon]
MKVDNSLKFIIDFDKRLFDFINNQRLNEPYLFLSPNNRANQESLFFERLAAGASYEPSFEYDDLGFEQEINTLNSFKEEIKLAKLDEFFNKLRGFYIDKIDEIILFAKLIESRGTNKFNNYSIQAYGSPTKKDFLLAFFIAKIYYYYGVIGKFFKKRYLSRDDIYLYFKSFFFKKNMIGWKLEFDDGLLSTAVLISHEKKVVLNGRHSFTKQEIMMLIRHELGVHALRNIEGGKVLDLFAFGFAKYDFLEEGLATYKEFGFYNPLDVLIGPALKLIAVYKANNLSFFETYSYLKKLTSNSQLSFDLTLRAKRGTEFNVGAYTKDFLYFKGYTKLLVLTLKNIFNPFFINSLSIGKIGFGEIKDLDYLRKIKKLILNKRN